MVVWWKKRKEKINHLKVMLQNEKGKSGRRANGELVTVVREQKVMWGKLDLETVV